MIELILLVQFLGIIFVGGYDLELNSDTNGYTSSFLEMDLVKLTCAEAFFDGFQLGYCSVELGTLSMEHYGRSVSQEGKN